MSKKLNFKKKLKMKTNSFTLSKLQTDKLSKIAKLNGVSKSEVIQNLIDNL